MWGEVAPGLLKVGRVSGLTQNRRQRDGGESATSQPTGIQKIRWIFEWKVMSITRDIGMTSKMHSSDVPMFRRVNRSLGGAWVSGTLVSSLGRSLPEYPYIMYLHAHLVKIPARMYPSLVEKLRTLREGEVRETGSVSRKWDRLGNRQVPNI